MVLNDCVTFVSSNNALLRFLHTIPAAFGRPEFAAGTVSRSLLNVTVVVITAIAVLHG